MQSSRTKEDLSLCYLYAISSYAGILYNVHRQDSNGTDLMLSKDLTLDDGRKFNAMLRVQLKATSSPSQYQINGDFINYKLKAKSYNDLCKESSTPIILALLILPEDEKEWIHWTNEELVLHATMYWHSCKEKQLSDNTGTVTVRLDKKNVLNSLSLKQLLKTVAMEACL